MTETKYYPTAKNVLGPLPLIALLFVVTVVYASGLKDPAVRMALYCASLVYPIVIIVGILGIIPKLNYVRLDDNGIHTTSMGVIHKTVMWKDIERIDEMRAGKVDSLGLLLKPSYGDTSWRMKQTKKIVGWDVVVSPAKARNGALLLDDVAKQFAAAQPDGKR